MKNYILTIIILTILAVLGFVAYKKVYQTKMMPTAIVELQKTVDDGGQADFDSLTKDASGL